jgi:hypothetical protein
MPEEEVRWKSWLATHGHGNVVTDENLSDFVPKEKPLPNTVQARPAAKDAKGTESKGITGIAPVGLPLQWLPTEPEAELVEELLRGAKEAWDEPAPEEGLGAVHPTHYWRQTTGAIEVRRGPSPFRSARGGAYRMTGDSLAKQAVVHCRG